MRTWPEHRAPIQQPHPVGTTIAIHRAEFQVSVIILRIAARQDRVAAERVLAVHEHRIAARLQPRLASTRRPASLPCTL
jgi:hypothetical protein